MKIEDLIIRDVKSDRESGIFGRGLAIEVAARAEVSRLLVERTQEHAIIANGSGATVVISDVVVRDTAPRDSDGFAGRAIAAQHDAHVDVTRAHFINSHEVAAFISGTVTASLSDVVIEATESRPDGVGGRGLNANSGARVTARGLLLVDNREFAVVAQHEGTRVELLDTIIRGTRPNACPEEECLGFGRGGTGVAAAKQAAVVMDRFVVEHNALAGLALTRQGTLDLSDGEVAFNPVGVNIDDESYDLMRLQHDVRYHDNGLTLQTTSLPEPRTDDVITGVVE